MTMSEPRAKPPANGKSLSAFVQRRPVTSAIIGLVLVSAVGSRLSAGSDTGVPTTAAAAPPTDVTQPVHWPSVLAARFVSASLKDPASAQYEDVTYRKRRGLNVLCGRVNAKNSFGGYTGFRQFIAVNSLVQIHDVGQRGRWSATWNDLCLHTDKDDPPAGSAPPNRTHLRPHHRATEASAAEVKP